MKTAYSIFVLLLLFSHSQQSQASSLKKYEFDLPSLVGSHSQSETLFSIPLNIDKFQEISDAELFLEGEAFPGSASRSEGGVDIPISLQVEISFQISDELKIALLGVEGMPVVEFGPLNGNFKDQKHLKPIPAHSPIDWSFAKKGKGVMILRWEMGYGMSLQTKKVTDLFLKEKKVTRRPLNCLLRRR